MGNRRIEMAGKQIGRLTVIRKDGKTKSGAWMWLCKCDCGNERIVCGADLRRKRTAIKSCGCVGAEKTSARSLRHGLTKTPTWHAWAAMRARCSNVNHNDFDNYGGRGIAVCDRWMNSFEAFLEDMGPRPSSEHSIDRFPNNDGSYEPGNCRWATSEEQNKNTRRTVFLTHDGQTLCAKDWAKKININYTTLHQRLSCGWSVERALTTPKGKYKR